MIIWSPAWGHQRRTRVRQAPLRRYITVPDIRYIAVSDSFAGGDELRKHRETLRTGGIKGYSMPDGLSVRFRIR